MLALIALAKLSNPTHAADVPFEQYQLDNGLNVILHEDHSLPQVVINLWYDVGSKDEAQGKTGFAHLFEHLMFMGTTRLPGSGFDDRMEAHGGWNNAWTSEDATDYYDVGPANLLETFLWMEADRMEGLAKAMTKAKLNLQRDVVRNELRQSVENEPYGILELAYPPAMWPEVHPYAHSVIGSHKDLQAATVADVVGFFNTWYVPSNASLVVAGDFDPAQAKGWIERYFGSLPTAPIKAREAVAQPDVPIEAFVEVEDNVQIPLTTLMWHSPAALQPGDAEYDLLAGVLTEGRSSRLYKRLVHSEQSALEVSAFQYSMQRGSVFFIDAKPAEGHTMEELEGKIMEELARLATEGPTQEELDRVRNNLEIEFLHRVESLQARAMALNRYRVLVGDPGWIEKDLDRYRSATLADVQAAAAKLTEQRRCIAHVVPAEGAEGSEGGEE